MSATMLLEKKVDLSGENKAQQAAKSIINECTCGTTHMASHNAMCQACSMQMTSAK